MVILLDGLSQMSRVTIAEAAILDQTQWRHLALEVLAGSILPDTEEGDAHLEMIKKCALELEKDGLHLFLTMPADSPHRVLLAQALRPKCITVHLGEEGEEDYDFTIDPSMSVNEVTAMLRSIMTPTGE